MLQQNRSKVWRQGFFNLVLAFQPLFAAGVYLTFLVNNPPLWLSWCIALFPLAIRFWRSGKLVRRTPFDVPILIFIAGLIVGFVVSPDKAVSWQGLNTFLASILIYYGIVSNSEAKTNYWLVLGVILCLIIIGLTIYTFSQGDGRRYFFNEWVYQLFTSNTKGGALQPSYNTAGAALGIAIPLLLGLTLFKRHSRLLPWVAATLLIFLVLLFLIGSGGGWVSAIIGSIFVLACWKLWSLAVTLPAIGLGSWVVVTSLNKTSELAHTWVAQMFPHSSFATRIQFWRDTISLLRSHLITGLGLGNWYERYLAYTGHPLINPHDSYLQLYADTGLLGGIAIVGAAVVFGYLYWRILHSFRRSNWDGMAIGIIGSILAGMIDAVYEVNTSAPILKNGAITSYIAIPYLWFWAAFFIVAFNRLHLRRDTKKVGSSTVPE